ncbi:MAG: EF-hand domain-containing protein [Desulfovibrio sp.]|uniref:EF-hand domain-containing protein n=1 Tax=Desulfovibrio sp. 7SRBS1 TaxID=3378064 RepID=UPI003B3F13EB
MNRSAFFLCLLCLLAIALPAQASDQCFGIVNQTMDPIRIFSKTGSMTYKKIASQTIDSFCCPSSAPLCFDKSDGTTKAKAVREDPNGLDEWSGLTCRKIRIKPGQSIAVSLGADGKHIDCRFVDAATFVPSFEKVDTNHDGKIDRNEARAINVNLDDFKVSDKDNPYYMDKDEYQSTFSKINIFKGVRF